MMQPTYDLITKTAIVMDDHEGDICHIQCLPTGHGHTPTLDTNYWRETDRYVCWACGQRIKLRIGKLNPPDLFQQHYL